MLRDALVSLLAEQRRKVMSGGELCLKTFLNALLETREASLEVIDAITRYDAAVPPQYHTELTPGLFIAVFTDDTTTILHYVLYMCSSDSFCSSLGAVR